MGKTVTTLQSQLEALIKAPSPAAPSSRIFCNEGKTELRQATATSRTPPWLPSGWGCRDRRLSRLRAECCKTTAARRRARRFPRCRCLASLMLPSWYAISSGIYLGRDSSVLAGTTRMNRSRFFDSAILANRRLGPRAPSTFTIRVHS
jgi:hypothetical protein